LTDAVVMVGIAFGKDSSEQKIGDVLVSTMVQSYEVSKIYKDKIDLSGPRPEAGPELLNRFRNVHTWEFRLPQGISELIPGLMLSGEKKINNPDFKKSLFQQVPRAIGGDMESFAVYSACSKHKLTEWIVVKGISDWADGYESINKHENQALAARAAVSLCLAVFSEEVFEDFRESSNAKRQSEVEPPDEFCMFILLMSMQCSNSNFLVRSELETISGKLLTIMSKDIRINIDATLSSLNTNGFINGYEENLFGLRRNGRKFLYNYMENHWSLLEDVLQDSVDPNDTMQELLCKYIVENMPYEERIKRLDSIIDLLPLNSLLTRHMIVQKTLLFSMNSS
jgi:nucleoside phosphorylase